MITLSTEISVIQSVNAVKPFYKFFSSKITLGDPDFSHLIYDGRVPEERSAKPFCNLFIYI